MIYYIYFIICIIEIINIAAIKNENEVINTLSKSTSNKVSLNINSEIDLTKNITINNSIKTLYITGDSPDSSKLNLKYPLYFNSNIKELEIKNISINGNLFFKNNKKIKLTTVNLNGYIDSDFDENSNNHIEIAKLNFRSTKKSVENCINLSGNININKSNFYSNSSCENRLLHYNGYKKYTFDLKESNFDGEYECSFLSIEEASNANIESIIFEKGYSSIYIDGGYIKKIKKKILYIKNIIIVVVIVVFIKIFISSEFYYILIILLTIIKICYKSNYFKYKYK